MGRISEYPDGVKEDDGDGDRGDVADEDLPCGVSGFAGHREFTLTGFLGHQPAGKNGDADSSQWQHQVRSQKIELFEKVQAEEFDLGPDVKREGGP